MNNKLHHAGVGVWVGLGKCYQTLQGGWVENGHYRHDVIMQWPLTLVNVM